MCVIKTELSCVTKSLRFLNDPRVELSGDPDGIVIAMMVDDYQFRLRADVPNTSKATLQRPPGVECAYAEGEIPSAGSQALIPLLIQRELTATPLTTASPKYGLVSKRNTIPRHVVLR